MNINDALGGGEDMDDNITFDDMDEFDGADDDIENVSLLEISMCRPADEICTT